MKRIVKASKGPFCLIDGTIFPHKGLIKCSFVDNAPATNRSEGGDAMSRCRAVARDRNVQLSTEEAVPLGRSVFVKNILSFIMCV